jgi:hypothetical protein
MSSEHEDRSAVNGAAPAYESWLHEKQHQVMYAAELSALYHGKRERFLLTCERASQAAAALTATAAFSQIAAGNQVLLGVSSVMAAVASILPLVFGWASRANKHAVLAGDHRRLLARMQAAGFVLTEQQVSAFRSELTAIEAAEDASLGALVVQCQNEIAAATNNPESIVPLTRSQRALMHVFDFDVQPSVAREPAPAKP